jgi:hypothetical protein
VQRVFDIGLMKEKACFETIWSWQVSGEYAACGVSHLGSGCKAIIPLSNSL